MRKEVGRVSNNLHPDSILQRPIQDIISPAARNVLINLQDEGKALTVIQRTQLRLYQKNTALLNYILATIPPTFRNIFATEVHARVLWERLAQLSEPHSQAMLRQLLQTASIIPSITRPSDVIA